MKASEYIAKLQALVAEHGDLDVGICTPHGPDISALDGPVVIESLQCTYIRITCAD